MTTPTTVKAVIISLLICCLVAPWALHISSVPITFQTLILFGTAAVFGKKTGLIAGALYLLAGASGLPVFGNFTGGYEKLTGPTSGFLWAFPLLMYYTGWECERREVTFIDHIIVFFRAHLLLLIPGFAVLYFAYEGVLLWPTLVKLLPGLMIKTIAGGILTAYIAKRLPPGWTEVSD